MKQLLIGWLVIALMLLLLILIGISIYCFVTYGGKSISEIPVWALWFMWGN